MKKFFLPAVALSVSLFALVFLAPSGASAGVGVGTSKYHKTQKDETYMVIKVGDTYKAIATSRYKDEKKKVEDDNKEKLKEWHDLIKTDSTAPKPKQASIKIIKRDYETEKVAQDYADKLTDEELNKENHKTKVDEKK